MYLGSAASWSFFWSEIRKNGTTTKRSDHITPVLRTLHCIPVVYRIQFQILLLVYKAHKGPALQYISGNSCLFVSWSSWKSHFHVIYLCWTLCFIVGTWEEITTHSASLTRFKMSVYCVFRRTGWVHMLLCYFLPFPARCEQWALALRTVPYFILVL